MKHETVRRSVAIVVCAVIVGCNAAERSASLESGILLENMDTATRPGDDFYRYANGVWLETTVIPEDKSVYWMASLLFEKAQGDLQEIIRGVSTSSHEVGTDAQMVGDLYASFLDAEARSTAGMEPLREDFERIEAIHDPESLTAYFAYSSKLGFNCPFYALVEEDYKKPTESSLYIRQAGLGLPDRAYYLEDTEEFTGIRASYVEHIAKMLAEAGVPEEAATASKILDLETAIAGHHGSKEEARDQNRMYNPFEVDALSKSTTNLVWPVFLAELGVPELDRVVIWQPEFIDGIDGLIASVELDTWKSYLKWHVIHASAGYLNNALETESFRFYGALLRGIPEPPSRAERGAGIVNEYLGQPAARLYVAEHFAPETKEQMLELVENLIAAYGERIKRLDWMGEETKGRALEKLAKISAKIGYPDAWSDTSSIEIVRNDLFGNVRRAQLHRHSVEIGKLTGPLNRSDWWVLPQEPNAYYNPSRNEVVFTAALLQPPLFNMDVEDAVKYGIVGGLIGHEITHGFDDEGSAFDGEGALENWWTEADREEFEKRSGKLVEQYDAYEVLDGLHINGEVTLGENIADLGSLSIALEAYAMSLDGKDAPVLDGFSGEQRVFLGYAQGWRAKMREEALRMSVNAGHHAPFEFRVNGVVRNLPEFYTLFDVAPSDKLYLAPSERIQIW